MSLMNHSGDDEIKDSSVKPKLLQKGVLRTNCIDCLDRTNVAQYAYGLVALGRQLQALGFIESLRIDLDNPLAKEVMTAYESMGDKLAFQYGGSAAHNK
ncbi:polyphosphoinositide phosphatase-like, partial [Trifolium medium]|nr:polyphosphoinositide phosphatase-like [Trifolium medium]